MEDIQNTTVETNEAAVEDEEDLFESASWEDTSDIPADNDTEEEENLDEETDSDETEETSESSEDTDQSDSSEHDQPDFMKIKFNKEEISLSRDQAVELAQKGMNYDRIYEGYQTAAPIVNEINRLAQANGMSAQDFMMNLYKIWVCI